ncbi:Crp/Fnr family transcriptional regulator [Streptomyces sp. NPDC059679]|uniref:Crp/Fnr family transcriptional regulator n=1 Tax=Streptomyces sp. NPDC059679 TaxID=3346903 RepID=UPI00367E6A3F
MAMAGDEPEPLTWRALGAVPLFASLPEARLRELWAASVPRGHPVGSVLRSAGAPADHLLVLLRGRVAATGTTGGGRVVRYGQWDGPCALDKVALLDGRGHTATFTALTCCAVRSVRRDRFLGLVDDTAAVRAHVFAVLARQARAQQQRLTETATLPAEARLAGWLLAQAAASAPGVVSVRIPGTQQELADTLGVTRVTVNRALARLRRDGLIRVERGCVHLLAPESLALRAGDEHGNENGAQGL